MTDKTKWFADRKWGVFVHWRAWGDSPSRFLTELIVGYTRYINQHGGVVTWDVPVSLTGNIPETFLDQLRAINQ